ncbi:hypothetical protein NE237_022243 [Protea cynaroides]|uniref:C-JID domain-containing protein n=1 Tax=Protea cynaroides TaxID=273540 RepID=A0A9Q0HEQ5_9MAGN|nr:hypothetical protein NE237_022243 [Protea cynaroides]
MLKGLQFSIEAFAKMQNLRLLKVDYIHLTEDYRHILQDAFSLSREKHLFEMLRWLCWHGFPLKYLPAKFHLEKLVILDMQHSDIKQVWKGTKLLMNLKVLNLSHCRFLTSTPDFRGLSNLERLVLEGCTNLVEVHQSIGHLGKIVYLNLKDCKSLWNLPSSISKLKSLENFIISGCSKVEKLPDGLGNMDCLKELLADGTAIKQLPSSIRLLKNLRTLSLCGYKGSSKSWVPFFWSLVSPRKIPDSITQLVASFSGLCSLKRLLLQDCSLSEGAIPSDIGTLCSLEELDLSYNNFCSLPPSISSLSRLQTFKLSNCTKLQSLPKLPVTLKRLYAESCTSMETLPNLECASSLQLLELAHNNFSSLPTNLRYFSQLDSLELSNCTRLQSLPELPANIKGLRADGCTSLERIENLSNSKYLKSLMLDYCEKLTEIVGLEGLVSVPSIHLDKCNNLANAFKINLFQRMAEDSERGLFDTFLPGSEIPEWFHYRRAGSSISFKVPPQENLKIEGLILCAVYAANEELADTRDGPSASVSNRTKALEWNYQPISNSASVTRQDHMWISNIPHVVFGNQLESGDRVDVSIVVKKIFQVKECGIHLVYESIEKAEISNSRSMFWEMERPVPWSPWIN